MKELMRKIARDWVILTCLTLSLATIVFMLADSLGI